MNTILLNELYLKQTEDGISPHELNKLLLRDPAPNGHFTTQMNLVTLVMDHMCCSQCWITR